MRRRSKVVPGVVLLAILSTAPAALRALAQAPDETAKEHSMKGMVAAVDVDERQVRVLTGTGHSLRMMVFHADTSCRIRVDQAAAELRNLRRGQVVVVRYGETSARHLEAKSIAATPMPASGETR